MNRGCGKCQFRHDILPSSFSYRSVSTLFFHPVKPAVFILIWPSPSGRVNASLHLGTRATTLPCLTLFYGSLVSLMTDFVCEYPFVHANHTIFGAFGYLFINPSCICFTKTFTHYVLRCLMDQGTSHQHSNSHHYRYMLYSRYRIQFQIP